MIPLTHKWLWIPVMLMWIGLVVCETATATEPAGTSPVLHAMPRSPHTEKKPVPAIEIEPEAQISETPVTEEPATAVQDHMVADEANTVIEAINGAVSSYEPKSRLDPFMPLIQEKTATPPDAQKPDRPRRVLTPLEKMSLSQIKLVAVVMGEDMKLAMVEEATGKGYEVRIGTYMGKNGGQVVDIQSDRIIVREMVTDFKGTVTERFEELKLHKADSGD